MISEKVQEAINAQINAELHSAYIYLAMSMDACHKGMRGVAHWMRKQCEEEMQHAFKFMVYLNQQSAQVKLKPIAGVPATWECAKCMFEQALEHERKVTAYIHHLCYVAEEEKDYATSALLQWYVQEQVEEEESTRSIVEAFECVGDDKAAMYMLDCNLMKR